MERARDPATIFALSTPPGIGGIAVVRLSGPDCDRILRRVTAAQRLPAYRVASLRRLVGPEGDPIDECLVLRFAAGASFTGEASAEIHCHGGRAVVQAVLNLLAAQPEARLAEPGEFTRRALLNGRLDLAEVEALGDLVTAETEWQRRQALSGLTGALHGQIEAWRQTLLDCLALIEVTIDWVDEEVPGDVPGEVEGKLAGLAAEIAAEIRGSVGRERLRSGFEVAILGAPNCGKSSFINVLAGRQAALASPLPGTTRDVIELHYDLKGLPVTFLDMAGLRDTSDAIERMGIEQAVARARAADLRLHFVSADAPQPALCEALREPGDLRVWTKADIAEGSGDHVISVVESRGLGDLLEAVGQILLDRIPRSGVIGHARQREALEACLAAIGRARERLGHGTAELAAEELRESIGSLGDVVGGRGVEELLDRVFSKFCLGK